MPNRIIREGLITSKRISAMSPRAQLFYLHVLLLADDFGRYTAEPVLLRNDTFPWNVETVSLDDIRGWLAECTSRDGLRDCEKPPMMVYEVGGKPYLQIDNFGQQRRAQKSKFPDPPASAKQPIASDSNRGQMHTQAESEAEANAKPEPDFDVSVYSERMYARHPRKGNKTLVEHECVRIAAKGGKTLLERIDKTHENWCNSDEWKRDGGKWVTGLHKWLNDECYTQEPPRAGGGVDYAVIPRLSGVAR